MKLGRPTTESHLDDWNRETARNSTDIEGVEIRLYSSARIDAYLPLGCEDVNRHRQTPHALTQQTPGVKKQSIDPNLHRFWLPGGYFFEIPSWEWPLAVDWCWSCGDDDFVIYEDPDHPGWYLLYNLHTGAFVQVMYMGM